MDRTLDAIAPQAQPSAGARELARASPLEGARDDADAAHTTTTTPLPPAGGAFSSDELFFLRVGYNRYKGDWARILKSYPFAASRSPESLQRAWNAKLREPTYEEAAPLLGAPSRKKRSAAAAAAPRLDSPTTMRRELALQRARAKHARILNLYDDSTDHNAAFDTPKSAALAADVEDENNSALSNLTPDKERTSPAEASKFTYDFAEWDEPHAATTPLRSVVSRIVSALRWPLRAWTSRRPPSPSEAIVRLLQCDSEQALRQAVSEIEACMPVAPDSQVERQATSRLAGEFWDKWNARSGPVPALARALVLKLAV